jgi:cell pole-organizing protein PopZ
VSPEAVLELTDDIADTPPASPIVSPDALAASRQALSNLSRLIVKPEIAGSDTLEGLVREMLKPMLKDWLDAHLPALVERVVAQEVARITGQDPA